MFTLNQPLAESGAGTAIDRRRLLGLAGTAGIVGAAIAAYGTRTVAASPIPATEADIEILQVAMAAELTSSELYAAAAASLRDAEAELMSVISGNHLAYGQAIAGSAGVSANEFANEQLAALRPLFEQSNPQDVARAGRDLENTLVATHTQLLTSYESISALELTASILTVEARHAAVLTSLAGFASNLDDMLAPAATPLGAVA